MVYSTTEPKPPIVLSPIVSGVNLPDKQNLKLIHTSDIHLGDEIGHPASVEALKAVVDAVPGLGGDVLLLVGDIFDNGRVGNDVLEGFLDQISRLTVPAVLLPGNHDLYADDSVYLREPFNHKPENLHLFIDALGQTITFPELTLDLWGRAMPFHTPEFRPLAGMPQANEGHWLVALAHGHYHYDDDRDQRSSPIYPDEVANANCHYLALGHWDRHVEVSHGKVIAAYSGTPLGPSRNQPVGQVSVVDLNPQTGVSLSRASL
jgi:DNA repair exonuclease SbcCD nuclease subunit